MWQPRHRAPGEVCGRSPAWETGEGDTRLTLPRGSLLPRCCRQPDGAIGAEAPPELRQRFWEKAGLVGGGWGHPFPLVPPPGTCRGGPEHLKLLPQHIPWMSRDVGEAAFGEKPDKGRVVKAVCECSRGGGGVLFLRTPAARGYAAGSVRPSVHVLLPMCPPFFPEQVPAKAGQRRAWDAPAPRHPPPATSWVGASPGGKKHLPHRKLILTRRGGN